MHYHEPHRDHEFPQDKLERPLDQLSPREREIIRLRFGLEDGRKHRLKEVAKKFNVSRERIRQIEQKVLGKLMKKKPSQEGATWRFNDDLEDYRSLVEAYMQDVSKIPPFSPEQEKELTKRAVTGDREARDRLMTANLRLVVSVAEEYMKLKVGLSFLDLIQEGNLGLMKAIETFDPTKRYKFSDYAMGWISKAITQAIEHQSSTIRRSLDEELEKALKQLNDREKDILKLRYGLEDGHPRTLKDVAQKFNITRERVRESEIKALEKLKHPSRKEELRKFRDLRLSED